MAAGHVQEFQLTRNTTTACLPCSSALRLGLLVQLVGLAAKYSSEAHFLFFFFVIHYRSIHWPVAFVGDH